MKVCIFGEWKGKRRIGSHELKNWVIREALIPAVCPKDPRHPEGQILKSNQGNFVCCNCGAYIGPAGEHIHELDYDPYPEELPEDKRKGPGPEVYELMREGG